jgi:hypothetical protein
LLLVTIVEPGIAPAYPACNRDEVTLVRAGTADLTGSAVL